MKAMRLTLAALFVVTLGFTMGYLNIVQGQSGASRPAIDHRPRSERFRPSGAVEDDPVQDPEDDGLDITAFADFMRSTMAPARGPITADVQAGEAVFGTIGCAVCHVPAIRTARPGTRVNGGAFTVPDPSGTRSSIRTATSCCTTSGRATASRSCRPPNPRRPRIRSGLLHCGPSGLATA